MRYLYFTAFTLVMVFLIGCERSQTEPPGKARVIQELNRMAPSQKNEGRRDNVINEDRKIPNINDSSNYEDNSYEIPHSLFILFKISMYILFCIIILGIIYLIFFSSGHVRFSDAIIHPWVKGKKNSEPSIHEDEQTPSQLIVDFESLLNQEDVPGALLILYSSSIHSLINKGFFLKKDRLTNNEIKSLLKEDERLRDVFSQLADEVERSIFGHKKIDRADCLKLFQRYQEVF